MTKHHSGSDYTRAAPKSPKFDHMRTGKGDHIVVYADDGSNCAVPMHRELATGTECFIRKWFREHLNLVLAGLVAFLLIAGLAACR